ncbi:MAG: hypothetical protein CVV42_02005 [Candidatus Riflebacteria bacterium HGW-Riflebacteria-2]|jgi:hypothetical protein|nr:MAG: hypothetical protein CVV42_02005 [Candidatus Riflebacteria bacterium HGW-Riflebacteria-2]
MQRNRSRPDNSWQKIVIARAKGYAKAHSKLRGLKTGLLFRQLVSKRSAGEKATRLKAEATESELINELLYKSVLSNFPFSVRLPRSARNDN